MDVRIRPATSDDVTTLAGIQERAALAAYAHIFPPDAPKPSPGVLELLWSRAITAPEVDTTVWSAEMSGNVVGGVVLAAERDDDLRLSRLYVDPDRWSSGVGRRLLDTAVDEARSRSAPGVLLWVLEANRRARWWYERRGWQLTGNRQAAGETVEEVEYRLALPRRLADRALTEPHASRLPTGSPGRDEVIARHAEALEAGESGYTDPTTGLFVFTAGYLADRGYCCDTGCRHCPYVD